MARSKKATHNPFTIHNSEFAPFHVLCNLPPPFPTYHLRPTIYLVNPRSQEQAARPLAATKHTKAPCKAAGRPVQGL